MHYYEVASLWRNFSTTLKHKRQEISVENMTASLDVEEKVRAKNTTDRGGFSLTPTRCRKNVTTRTKRILSPSLIDLRKLQPSRKKR
jgi:hypothetical protein